MLVSLWGAFIDDDTVAPPAPSTFAGGGAKAPARRRAPERIPQHIIRRTGTLHLRVHLGGITRRIPDPVRHDEEAQFLRDTDGGFP